MGITDDLIEALESILPYAESRVEDMLETPDERSAQAVERLDKARAAIAKAKVE